MSAAISSADPLAGIGQVQVPLTASNGRGSLPLALGAVVIFVFTIFPRHVSTLALQSPAPFFQQVIHNNQLGRVIPFSVVSR